MEKIYPECLIIDRPDLKSKTRLLGESLLTILFWGFWFYLWLPLVSLLAWLFGFQVAYRHMIEFGGLAGVVEKYSIFLTGIGTLSLGVLLWSVYNLKRYGKMSRRNRVLVTDMENLSADLDLSRDELANIHTAKTVQFTFLEQGEIDGINYPA